MNMNVSKRLTKRRVNTDIMQLKDFKDIKILTNLIEASKEKQLPDLEVNNEEALTELFSEEEAEAEHLLDELNWNGNGVDGANRNQLDLQLLLGKQSEQLNCEIIDFLLQWEEMDDITDLKNVSSPKSNIAVSGVRDTREVLTALSLVDAELAAVDLWLGEQIERLGEIQSNLHMIEDESGALETSWFNLHNMQEVVQTIVHGYSVDPRHQKILSTPAEELFSFVVKSASLNSVRSTMRPLLEALTALRTALDLKSNNIILPISSNERNSVPISAAQWKQLQSIAAITSQRAKLSDLSSTFCANFREFILGVFDMLLRHKALNLEGSTSSVVVKQFNLQPLIDKFVVGRNVRTGFRRTADIEEQESAAAAEQTILPQLSVQNNQLLQAQQAFQTALADFVPLLDLFVELSPNYSRPLCEAYIRAMQGFYHSLAKTLAKDLNAQVLSSKTQRISLMTCAKFHIGSSQNENLVPLHFNHVRQHGQVASGTGQITSWMAFRVALLVLAPVLESEEHFVKATFHLDSRYQQPATSSSLVIPDLATFSSSKLCAVLDAIFESTIARVEGALLHCAGTDGVVDGVETIAMLTVLYQFSHQYPAISPFVDGNELNVVTHDAEEDADHHALPQSTGEPNNLFLFKTLASFRGTLLARLTTFAAEQMSWINAQKSGFKSPVVLTPFARFPALILQISEMTNGIYFDYVDDLLCKLAKELFNWLTSVAKQSDKYADKIRITNFTFFETALRPFNIAALETFVEYAAQQKVESMARYVSWMVSYEFPALSALAVRMDGVGQRVNEEELSLYIRRKDVLNVVKEVEVVRTLETNVATLRKRLEKHFLSENDEELGLVSQSWQQIKQRVVRILTRLEEAASVSYQITLDVGPKTVRDIFDKHTAPPPHNSGKNALPPSA